jgi:K+-transporting ATPase ATPase A chain
MSGDEAWQIVVFFAVLLLSVKPLGGYMAAVYEGRTNWVRERWIYRLAGVDANSLMTWKSYAGAFLMFNALGLLAVYALLRVQHLLPWNPQAHTGVAPHTAFNIAISFATNTNWQNYSGEATLSYLTQMAGLTVQNFASAASGMAVMAALARGLASRNTDRIGNFWVDMIRSILYILLPLSVLLTVLLISQGVVQNFD